MTNANSEEVWVKIPEYSKYLASNLGRIMRTSYTTTRIKHTGSKGTLRIKEKIFKGFKHSGGYITVELINDSGINVRQYIHRLVALTFLENPSRYPILNHIDSNKKNNNIHNLEWCSYSHNLKHSIDFLGKPRRQKTLKEDK
jgi:hypothetical protein